MVSDWFAKGNLPQLHAMLCGPTGDRMAMCVSPQAYGLNIGVTLCSALGLLAALFYFLASRTIKDDFLH